MARNVDYEELEESERPGSVPARLLARATRDPVTSIGFLVTAATMVMIATNAAFLQPERHPAPLFETRPFDAAAAPGARAVAVQRIRMPASADLVRDLQSALRERGFYDGPVDGVFGQMTEEGIRRFQASAGLAVTGAPSEKLLAQVQLFAGTAPSGPGADEDAMVGATPVSSVPVSPVSVGSVPVPVAAPTSGDAASRVLDPERRAIADAQSLLNELGYGPLEVDGYAGTATAEAVSRFQRDRGMAVTGSLDANVVRSLRSFAGSAR